MNANLNVQKRKHYRTQLYQVLFGRAYHNRVPAYAAMWSLEPHQAFASPGRCKLLQDYAVNAGITFG